MHSADTALIVIDVQESFRHRPYWDEAPVPRFLDRLQALIDGARAAGLPIAQVFHVDAEGPFAIASGHVRTLDGLRIDADAVFHKSRHSALVGSGLGTWLIGRRIGRVIVAGIRTEQCCETTARHASDLGYAVDFVTEATLTFAMTDRHGRRWEAGEIAARTELVLADRFARIVGVSEALAGSLARAA